MHTIVNKIELSTEVFGIRLKSERRRLKFSQEDFAASGGVGRATQYLYEHGDRSPTVEYLLKILAIGVDLNYLVFGEKSEPKEDFCYFDSRLLMDAFKLVDEFARDEKGRLLDIEYRMAMFETLIRSLAGVHHEDADWRQLRENLTLVSS